VEMGRGFWVTLASRAEGVGDNGQGIAGGDSGRGPLVYHLLNSKSVVG